MVTHHQISLPTLLVEDIPLRFKIQQQKNKLCMYTVKYNNIFFVLLATNFGHYVHH